MATDSEDVAARRRKSHNKVEQRRQQRINAGISQLQALLEQNGRDPGSNKAATISNAAVLIEQLAAANATSGLAGLQAAAAAVSDAGAHGVLGAAVAELRSEAVTVVDSRGTVIAVNQGAADLTGFSADELTGRPVTAHISPIAWNQLLQAAKAPRGATGAGAGVPVRRAVKGGQVVWTTAEVQEISEGRYVLTERETVVAAPRPVPSVSALQRQQEALLAQQAQILQSLGLPPTMLLGGVSAPAPSPGQVPSAPLPPPPTSSGAAVAEDRPAKRARSDSGVPSSGAAIAPLLSAVSQASQS